MAVRALSDEELRQVQPIPQQPEQDAEARAASPGEARAQLPAAPDTSPTQGGVRELSPEELDRVEPERGTGEKLAMSAGGGFLRGVANVLGLPADLANKAAIAAGLEDELGASEDPVGGSRSIQRGFNKLGAGLAPGEEYPSELVGTVGEVVGGASVPFAGIGAAARTGAQGNILTKPILDIFRRYPKANAAGELGAATGAGAGAGVAREVAPESEGAEIAGTLIGGFASPLAVGTRALPAAGRGLKRTFDPLLPGGAKRQAARQLRGVVDDPQAAAKSLEGQPDAVPGAQLTPAQETQDPGLLRLERALVRGNADLEGRFDELADQTNRALLKEGGELATDVPVERTREFLEGRLQRLSEALDARGAQALERARQRVQELEPAARRRGESSRIVREEIEGALADAKAQESELWDAVPKDAPTPTATLKRTYAGLLEQQRKADPIGNIPPYVRRLLREDGKLGDVETVEEVQALRSRLLQSIREEQAKDAPNRKKIASLERLQEAALEDLGALADDAGSQAGEQLREALAFSRDLNKRFRQGPVGRVLGKERRGGSSVAPEATLEKLLTKEGPEGGVNLKALDEAFKESPVRAAKYRDAAADFVRARFAQQATDDGGAVRPGAANRFVKRNRDLLENFPALRRELEDAESAQRVADDVVERMGLRKRGLFDKRTSRASLFLNAPVNKEITRVMRSRKPVETMRQLVRQVRKDPTGEAHKGLKGQFLRDMFGRSQLQSFETQGRVRASGEDLARFLEENKALVNQTGLFTPDETQRLRKIVDTAKKVDRAAARGRSLDELLDESPDTLVDLVARITGANIGARGAAGSTGAPIVAAGAGSRFVRNITNRIPMERTRDVLAQAMLDRDLMRELLRKVDSPQAQEEVQRRLNAFLVNLLPEAEQAEQQQEQEGP